LISKAQIGYDYAPYDIGFAAGANQVYGDAQTITTTPSAHVTFTYNTTPFVNYVLEAQGGQLAGGSAINSVSGREFINNYAAVIFRGQLQAGEIIDYSQSSIANAFKNLYLSAGIGYMINHIVKINRYSYKLPGFYTGGANNSTELFIPARIGYEFKIFNSYNNPSVKIDLAYQYNYMFGDNLDGFKTGKTKDVYSQFTVGVKFAIGSVISYRKQIQY
jgi:hypothetical protein